MLPSVKIATHSVPGHPEDLSFLRARIRAIFWVILLSNLFFAVSDALLEPSRWTILATPKLVNAAIILVALPLLRRDRRWMIATALAAFAISALVSASAGTITNEYQPTMALCTTAALMTAALVPWGTWAQVGFVLILGVVLAGLVLWIEPAALTLSYVNLAQAVALALSVYVAHALETHRRSMQRAVTAADAANNAKSAFLAAMSHEVRTPIGIVLGMTELLSSTKLEPRQRGFVESIRASGETLLNLVNDILDFSKIEAGRLEPQIDDGDVLDLVDGVVHLFRAAAAKNSNEIHIDVAPDVPRHLRADFPRLRQVLSNLISNAVKFTEHGRIDVVVELVELSSQRARLRFTVRDTGIGIDSAAQASIFEVFSQATATTARQYGGTGLGLAICKRLTELMGGEISVDSTPGRGSAFSFTVSMDLPSPPRPADAKPGPTNGRILVADDDLVTRTVLVGLLERLGIEADSVDNGSEAVAVTARSDYTAVLMDCHMPGLDGVEASREIRRRERQSGEHVPIIAVSAAADPEDRQECRAAGMEGFLTKPVRRQDLERLLRRYFPHLEETSGSAPAATQDAEPRALLKRFGDDAGLLRSTASVFLGESQALVAAVEAAAARDDLDGVERAAHKLRSAVANFAPHPAVEVAQQIEAAARDGDRQACRSALAALAAQVDALRRALARIAAVES